MSDLQKTKHPRREAIAVAREMIQLLTPACERIIVAGSLRRGKLMVSDVEILYIPKTETRKIDLLHDGQIDLAAEVLERAIRENLLARRTGRTGQTIWGDSNKLATHLPSGIPVDFFRTDSARWHNMLVCRTGSAQNNIRIATAAQARGLQWLPYGAGFWDQANKTTIEADSEEDVFKTVRLDFLEPKER